MQVNCPNLEPNHWSHLKERVACQSEPLVEAVGALGAVVVVKPLIKLGKRHVTWTGVCQWLHYSKREDIELLYIVPQPACGGVRVVWPKICNWKHPTTGNI